MGNRENHTPQDVGEFYDDQTSNFLRIYGQVIQAFRTRDVADLLKYQIASIGLTDGQRVLDAGCGVCGPARFFAKKLDVRIEAITISETQVKMAKQYVNQEGLDERIHVQKGDFHKLGTLFEPNTFDVVYYLESFGHAVDHEAVIAESWKVLKPGGTLYIKDLFIKEGIYEGHDEQIKTEIENINRAYRYNVADLYEVLSALRRQGFIINALKTIDLPLEQFENLTISNDFQELTGINKIEELSSYIFPVDFFELKCQKPWNRLERGNSRYFLQNHYYMQVHGKRDEDL
ncbi:MAG: hypothetical protein Salg2KO_15750 [Salibacteraceae bacterium]